MTELERLREQVKKPRVCDAEEIQRLRLELSLSYDALRQMERMANQLHGELEAANPVVKPLRRKSVWYNRGA